MDGKGRFRDNILIERLGRSLKDAGVSLSAGGNGHEARRGIAPWFTFYNQQRPHTVHRGRPPNAAYWTSGAEQHADRKH